MTTSDEGNRDDQTRNWPAPGQPPPPTQAHHPGYPYPYPYPPYRPTNGLAVASLVLGIIWIYWIGSVLALIFGYVARSQIRERGEGGAGLATAGIVLGWIGVGVLLAIMLMWFIV
ncbi:MAG: DUF4190 domain-containing protein, partial [Pseudonocardiaceae bacterium]